VSLPCKLTLYIQYYNFYSRLCVRALGRTTLISFQTKKRKQKTEKI
jgi:hypothetical protein